MGTVHIEAPIVPKPYIVNHIFLDFISYSKKGFYDTTDAYP